MATAAAVVVVVVDDVAVDDYSDAVDVFDEYSDADIVDVVVDDDYSDAVDVAVLLLMDIG